MMLCLTPALATVKTTTCEAAVPGSQGSARAPGTAMGSGGMSCPAEWDWNEARGLGRFAREAHQKKGVGGKDTTLSCARGGWKSLARKERK